MSRALKALFTPTPALSLSHNLGYNHIPIVAMAEAKRLLLLDVPSPTSPLLIQPI